MRRLAGFGIGFLMVCVAAWAGAAPEETPKDDNAKPPPELTDVSGHIVQADSSNTTGGVAYFIFQRRLMEIPQADPMAKVRAMAEVAVALDKDGSFTLSMAPGNYALVFDPDAAPTGDELKPGPDSFAVSKKLTPDQQKARIEVIKENGQKGLPIKDGKIGNGFIIENRIVRPPVTEFGDMQLGADHSVTVIAQTAEEKAVDFPVLLKLRGKNGDIYEAHPPSVSEPGKFVFHDVFPQEYEVFAIGQKPKPGAGDDVTTPSLKNSAFLFEGTPKDVKVTVVPRTKAESEAAEAPPADAPKAKKTTKR